MGLFFFRKEVNRFEFAQRLDEVDDKLQQLEDQQIQIAKQISILQDILIKIERAKAIEYAHEKFPSLEQRMNKGKKTRTRRVGTYAEKQYNEPFKVALHFKKIKYSLDSIAAILNSKGFQTPHGNQFQAKSVRDLLANKYQKQQLEYEISKNQKANGSINGNAGQIGLNSGYVPPF